MVPLCLELVDLWHNVHVYVYTLYIHNSVYFRILRERGQMPSAKIQGGGKSNPKGGGNPIFKDRESQLLRGANQSQGGGEKAPPGPPEINLA